MVSSLEASTLSLSPTTNSVIPGQTFTIDVMLNTQGVGVDGVDIKSLHYNPAIIQLEDADASTSGVQIGSGSLFPITLTNSVNTTTGTIDFSQVSSGGATYNGSGRLVTLTFRGVADGTSGVRFDFALGNSADTNVAGGGIDTLTSVTNGNYIVSTSGAYPTPTSDSLRDTISHSLSYSLSYSCRHISLCNTGDNFHFPIFLRFTNITIPNTRSS